MGTMVLVLLGDGVVANVLLKKSKGEGAGWIVIATGWGLGVTAGIFTAIACGSPGAHINPAVTLAVAIISVTALADKRRIAGAVQKIPSFAAWSAVSFQCGR